jgi:hypothetical protein
MDAAWALTAWKMLSPMSSMATPVMLSIFPDARLVSYCQNITPSEDSQWLFWTSSSFITQFHQVNSTSAYQQWLSCFGIFVFSVSSNHHLD